MAEALDAAAIERIAAAAHRLADNEAALADLFDVGNLPPHRAPWWLPVACVAFWPISVVLTAIADRLTRRHR